MTFSQTALLPYEVNKGNQAQRKQKIVEANDRLFNELFAKIRLKFALRTLDNKEKIKVLNQFKNRLKMEEFAYQQADKYEVLASSQIYEQMPNCKYYYFLFFEKINFLNKEIKRLIDKERKLNKIELESKK